MLASVFTDRKLAGRFQFTGEVLAIEQKAVAELRIGDRVLLLAKVFNPMLLKIK